MKVELASQSDRLALWTANPSRVRLKFDEDPHSAKSRLAQRPAAERKRVLVLGANGFVGINVLHELLPDDRIEHVYALVRPRKGASGADRLQAQLDRYGVTLPHLEKLTVLEGEFAEPMMGLGPKRYGDLCADVDCVIESAGSTNHAFSYRYYRKHSVRPTLQLLEFCYQERIKSLNVVGSIAADIYATRRDYYRFSFFYCGYTRMKLILKEIGVRAHEHGVPFHTCLAPMVLGGEPTGFKDPAMYYSFWQFAYYTLKTGKIWRSDQPWPIVMADVLARSVIDNMLAPEPLPIIYPRVPLTNNDIAELFELDVVDWDDFRESLYRDFPVVPHDIDWRRPLGSIKDRVPEATVIRALFPAAPKLLDAMARMEPTPLARPLPDDLRPIDAVLNSARQIEKLTQYTPAVRPTINDPAVR